MSFNRWQIWFIRPFSMYWPGDVDCYKTVAVYNSTQVLQSPHQPYFSGTNSIPDDT